MSQMLGTRRTRPIGAKVGANQTALYGTV
jgi:hypothetical protein